MAVSVSLVAPQIAFAESNDELKARIDKLEKMVSELKSELTARDKVQAMSSSDTSGGSGSIIEKLAGDIDVHGFVDTSYIFNANTPSGKTNSLRVFDTESNSFMLNLVELNLEKAVSMDSPFGFRVDLAYGNDASHFGSSGLGSTSDEFDLWQAYAQFMLPFSVPMFYETDIKAGKFATLLGAEVIESKDDWNFSRSFLFGYAIPFNHTGVRVHVKPFEEYDLDLTLGVVNGWDNVTDNNKAKTIEGQIAFSPMENMSFIVNGIFGSEKDDINGDYRTVIDLIWTYDVTDKLSLMANYDYGYEKNGVESGKDAQWDGVAGYAKYAIFDWWSIGCRGEYFHDRNGVRTGVASSIGINDASLYEFTITNEFKLHENLIFRVEFRHDGADEDVFAKDGTMCSYQNTISGEVIAMF